MGSWGSEAGRRRVLALNEKIYRYKLSFLLRDVAIACTLFGIVAVLIARDITLPFVDREGLRILLVGGGIYFLVQAFKHYTTKIIFKSDRIEVSNFNFRLKCVLYKDIEISMDKDSVGYTEISLTYHKDENIFGHITYINDAEHFGEELIKIPKEYFKRPSITRGYRMYKKWHVSRR